MIVDINTLFSGALPFYSFAPFNFYGNLILSRLDGKLCIFQYDGSQFHRTFKFVMLDFDVIVNSLQYFDNFIFSKNVPIDDLIVSYFSSGVVYASSSELCHLHNFDFTLKSSISCTGRSPWSGLFGYSEVIENKVFIHFDVCCFDGPHSSFWRTVIDEKAFSISFDLPFPIADCCSLNFNEIEVKI